MTRVLLLVFGVVAVFTAESACMSDEQSRAFPTPEDAVMALAQAVEQGSLGEIAAIFGPESEELAGSSDPATARRNREVFTVAVAEGWRLEDNATGGKTIVIGHEEWPFPIPLVRNGGGWRFDTAAGKEEVTVRRIGRNELAAMRICRTYVRAQRLYASRGRDGKPAGIYARTFASDPGRQNGLYWPSVQGQRRSPLGDLIVQAALEGRTTDRDRPPLTPFHGYHFRILTAQGPAAPGGAMNYVAAGEMTQGFALVAWPAQYNVTGLMTFMVDASGIVREKDLGIGTNQAARAMTHFNPDQSWEMVQ